MERAWLGWLDDVGATQSTLVATVDGVRNILSHGIDPHTPVPIASMSKAITAACLRNVIDEHDSLTFNSPLSDVMTLAGQHSNTRLISLKQFVQHTSGLDQDETQANVWNYVAGTLPTTDEVVARALARAPGETSAFFYNNENYEVLAKAIETLTGQNYFDACLDRVLRPLGIETAGPDNDWGALAGAGGWAITAPDYAKFFEWHVRMANDDVTPIGGGAFYGDGVFVRPVETGANVWHFGAVCLRGLRDSGAFSVVMSTGEAMTITYDICPNREQALALQRQLIPLLTVH
ncbi:MAG: serine hydrolase [Pseudomonadota bacterium]